MPRKHEESSDEEEDYTPREVKKVVKLADDDEDNDNNRKYGQDDVLLEDLHDGIKVGEDFVNFKQSYHEHKEWMIVSKETSVHECNECEKVLVKGDFISLGKRLFEKEENQICGVIGVDRVHWKCSDFYSPKPADDTTVNSFEDLVATIVGGEDKLKAVPGWDKLDIDTQVKLLQDAKLTVPQQLLDAQKEASKKRKREYLESINLDDLDTMSFRDLQAIAKKNKIKANQKKTELIQAIKTALTSEE